MLRQRCVRFDSRFARRGQCEILVIFIMTVFATFYIWGAAIACLLWNFTYLAVRGLSFKEGSSSSTILGVDLIRDLLLFKPLRTWHRRTGHPQARQTWNPFLDYESSVEHDGERTLWKSLVSSHRYAEPGVPLSLLKMPTQPAPGERHYRHKCVHRHFPWRSSSKGKCLNHAQNTILLQRTYKSWWRIVIWA